MGPPMVVRNTSLLGLELVLGHVNAQRSNAGWVPREINCTAG